MYIIGSVLIKWWVCLVWLGFTFVFVSHDIEMSYRKGWTIPEVYVCILPILSVVLTSLVE